MQHLLLMGTPGVGKTTLIREVLNPYRGSAGGFITLEMRDDAGGRLGFEIVSLPAGERRKFAGRDLASPVRLNKYGIDLTVLDSLGTASIERAMKDPSIKLVVMDEIGAMETRSAAFCAAAMKALRGAKPVLASIRKGNRPFCDEIKKIPELALVELTRADYPKVKARVGEWVHSVMERAL